MGIRIIFLSILLIFWLVMAGFSVQSLVVGLVPILFVLWLNRDFASSFAENRWSLKGKKIWLIFVYGLNLLWQIVLANIQVAKIVLSPQMPLQPAVVTFNPGLRSDLGKTILANSITLTPGTLTIDVKGDVFTVHALTLTSAQAVVEWPLINWLRRMEEVA